LKGCFFRKQRDDDASEEPNRIALQRFLKAAAKSFQNAGIFEHRIELAECLHATASRAFLATSGVA